MKHEGVPGTTAGPPGGRPSAGPAAPLDEVHRDEVRNVVIAHRPSAENAPADWNGPEGGLRLAPERRSAAQEALDGRARQQEALVRLGLEALASRDLDATLDLLVREAAAALDVDFCAVLEVGLDRSTFRLRADFGGSRRHVGTEAPGPLGDGQATYTLHTSAPVVSDDLRRETRFAVPAMEMRHGALSGLSVILHGKQQPWGVVGAFTRSLRTFTEHETNFLQAIANLMGLAVERDHVEAALRQRNRQQAAIVRLGLEALASRDLEATLDLLVRETGATLRADFCCALELADDRATFKLRASFGWPVGSEGAAALSAFGDSQAHYTISASAPVVSPDLSRETRFTVQPLMLREGAVSGMSVVLQGKKQAWGILAAHTKTLRSFTEEDINFLQAIANLMALAIERDRMEAALATRNHQQATVAALGRRALEGPHMDDLFAETARELASTLRVDLCEILQRTGDGSTLVLRAGVGWQPGLVGSARVPGGAKTQAGHVLRSEAPVVVQDLDDETRFEPSALLVDQGVASGISVLVPTRNGPFGILGAHSLTRRAFSQDDSNFVQAVANLLALAIERHRVEGQLRRHRDDLEGLVTERTALLAASNRELEAFSYTISHDLRAPLRSINAYSKLLARKHGDVLPPEGKEMLRDMADETVRMGKLIESILALSRLGSVTLTHELVDVSVCAASVLQALQATEPDRKVEWTVEPGLTAMGDGALLRIVVQNILENAWKFTARTAAASITVARETGGFSVADNGAGFDMMHARELFQPFHRLHVSEEFEGTGIGLATVSRIVGRHGGRVWAQGVPGKGATFHVTLPQDPLSAKTVAAALQIPGVGAHHPPPAPWDPSDH